MALGCAVRSSTGSCRPMVAFPWFLLVLSNLLLTIFSQIKFIVSELLGLC